MQVKVEWLNTDKSCTYGVSDYHVSKGGGSN